MRVIVTIAAVAFAQALQAETIERATILQGQQIYASNCAACHGANLQGQPDWKHRLATGRMPAPPHDVTGHTWHHSDRDLFTLTKRGVAAVVGVAMKATGPPLARS